jgi:hypothetical protein
MANYGEQIIKESATSPSLLGHSTDEQAHGSEKQVGGLHFLFHACCRM